VKGKLFREGAKRKKRGRRIKEEKWKTLQKSGKGGRTSPMAVSPARGGKGVRGQKRS